MDSSDEEKQLQQSIQQSQSDELITGTRLQRHIHKLLTTEQLLSHNNNKNKMRNNELSNADINQKQKQLLQQLSSDSRYEHDVCTYNYILFIHCIVVRTTCIYTSINTISTYIL